MRKVLSLSSVARKLAISNRVLLVLIIPLLILFLGNLRVFAQSLVWKEEGVIFSDPTIHNVEIIPLPDGKYRMYFHQATEMKSAISPAGRNFEIEPGTRLTAGGEFDPDNVVHPSIIALPQGEYKMYYDGEVTKTEQEFTWRILSATSPNGLTWAKDEGVRGDVGKSPLEADLVFIY